MLSLYHKRKKNTSFFAAAFLIFRFPLFPHSAFPQFSTYPHFLWITFFVLIFIHFQLHIFILIFPVSRLVPLVHIFLPPFIHRIPPLIHTRKSLIFKGFQGHFPRFSTIPPRLLLLLIFNILLQSTAYKAAAETNAINFQNSAAMFSLSRAYGRKYNQEKKKIARKFLQTKDFCLQKYTEYGTMYG